jgi:hypothetical protein
VTGVQSIIWGVATLASVAVVWAVRRSGQDWRRELRFLFLVSVVIGLFSIVSGLGNNATDEPHAMPGFLAELAGGHDPYTTTLSLTYTVHALSIWSNTVVGSYHYVYLPLLVFLQIPGTGAVGYELLCLACWAGMIYLLRNDEVASLALVSPFVALIAANGFTDLPVLFLVTLSVRGWTGPKARAVEYLSLGLKQFANAFWLVYYVLRRDVVRCLLVVAVTLAFAAPFLVWHRTGVWCEALTFGLGTGCGPVSNSRQTVLALVTHWNYYLWILWGLVVFDGELRDRGPARRRAGPTGRDPARSESRGPPRPFLSRVRVGELINRGGRPRPAGGTASARD